MLHRRALRTTALAAAALASAAHAQKMANTGFETGDFSGWAVEPTFNGQTFVEAVEIFDIDGPGPLPPSYAAKFAVGKVQYIGPADHGGIDLYQTLHMTAGSGYTLSYDWAAINLGPAHLLGGPWFGTFVGDAILSRVVAPGSFPPDTFVYGSVKGYHIPVESGYRRVGAQVTRTHTTTPTIAEGFHQFVDNFRLDYTPTGACCRNYLGCVTAAGPAHCQQLSGVYQGDNTTCATAGCPATGIWMSMPRPGWSAHISTTESLGLWFEAPANFRITFINVRQRWNSYQNFEVVRFTEPPPAGAVNGTNDFVSLVRVTQALPSPYLVSIEVRRGDIIGILGSAGTTEMEHALSPYYGFVSELNGDPVQFRRLAMAGNIINTPAHNLYTDANPGAQYGQIWIYYLLTPHCYANCDFTPWSPHQSGLTVDDFTCFIDAFVDGQSRPYEQQVVHYANCDNSTLVPVLNVNDFMCFVNAFAAGCP